MLLNGLGNPQPTNIFRPRCSLTFSDIVWLSRTPPLCLTPHSLSSGQVCPSPHTASLNEETTGNASRLSMLLIAPPSPPLPFSFALCQRLLPQYNDFSGHVAIARLDVGENGVEGGCRFRLGWFFGLFKRVRKLMRIIGLLTGSWEVDNVLLDDQ